MKLVTKPGTKVFRWYFENIYLILINEVKRPLTTRLPTKKTGSSRSKNNKYFFYSLWRKVELYFIKYSLYLEIEKFKLVK